MRKLLALVLCSGSLAVAPAAEAVWVPCGPSKAGTFIQGERSRVFSDDGELVACSRGSKRRRVLGYDGRRCGVGSPSAGCSGIDNAAVAGRFAAFSTYQCCSDLLDAVFLLEVRDLLTGRRRFSFRGGAIAREQAFLVRVVVRRTGSAAWTMSRSAQEPGARVAIEVRRSPGCGPTLLDSGPGIDARSLRRVGSRVTWQRGAITASARLC